MLALCQNCCKNIANCLAAFSFPNVCWMTLHLRTTIPLILSVFKPPLLHETVNSIHEGGCEEGARNPGRDSRSPPGRCFISLLTNIQPHALPALLKTVISQSTGGNIRLGEVNRTSAAHSASPGRLFPQGLLQLPFGLPLAKPRLNVPEANHCCFGSNFHQRLNWECVDVRLDGWKNRMGKWWDEHIYLVTMVLANGHKNLFAPDLATAFRNALVSNKWRKMASFCNCDFFNLCKGRQESTETCM